MINMLIDTITNSFMQSIEIPFLISLSKIIAFIFDPVVIAIASLIIAIFIYLKKSKKQGIFFAVTILITGIIIKVSKEIFQRARPLNAVIQESSFSLPSGHTMIAVVFFGLLVYLFVNKKYRICGMVVSGLLVIFIGLSRLYLRVHWLTDILTGLIVGTIILIFSILVFKKIS